MAGDETAVSTRVAPPGGARARHDTLDDGRTGRGGTRRDETTRRGEVRRDERRGVERRERDAYIRGS